MRMRTLLLATVLLLPAVTTLAGEDTRFIVVAAEGYVESVPDTLRLTVTIKQTRASLAEARKLVDGIVNQVTDIASDKGIADDDIDSSRLSAWPEYEWKNQQRRYLGESVQREVQLTVRKLDQYGPLLERLTALKLAGIQPPQLSHSQLEQLQLEALKVALARGKQKATTIAVEIGATLGPVMRVEEQGANQVQPRMAYAEARAASDSGGNQHRFSLAKQRITASVVVRYSLR
jgi:uncharacterized protein YggE